MPLPVLPTASEIRIASRLLPEQVSVTLANEAALEADIAGRIEEQANYVEMRIGQASAPRAWPLDAVYLSEVYKFYSPSQITAVGTRQASIASLAVKWLTLADLYDAAGQLNERYDAEAKMYRERGESLLAQIVGELQWQVSQFGDENEGSGLSMLTITVGERFAEEC